MAKRKTKEQKVREEKMYAQLNAAEAREKRAKARMSRAFNAWRTADKDLARIRKAIEQGPKEKARVGGEMNWTDPHFNDPLPVHTT